MQLVQYAMLMRLHRPVGTLILLWPVLIACWLATNGAPNGRLVLIFTLGTFLMRSAGCVINDYFDRKFDGRVRRTQDRPLATGKVSAQGALVLFGVLLIFAFLLVCATNMATIMLSLVAVGLASIYPLMKRITSFPQVVLGAAFAWGIPMVYAANEQALDLNCWILFTATLVWAIAYDTVYAMVDRADDQKIGIQSLAIFLGKWDKFTIAISHLLTLVLYVILGMRLGMASFYYVGIACALGIALYQQWLIRDRSETACFQAFLNNQYFGAVLFAGTLLSF